MMINNDDDDVRLHTCMQLQLFHHTEVHKATSFLAGTFQKYAVNSKYQSKGPIYNTFLSFCRNYTFKCIFLEKKNGIRDTDKKLCVMWDSREKGVGMQDQDPPSRPSIVTFLFLKGCQTSRVWELDTCRYGRSLSQR